MVRNSCILALTAVLFGLPMARAAEQVTLTNGFTMSCHHHAQSGAKTRLYLSAEESNFIELPTEKISGFIVVADPLPVQPTGEASFPGKPSQTAPGKEKLTPVDLHEMLSNAGQEHNLDVDLLASVVKAESGGNVHAVSHAGARGLMQLMPATAATLGVQDSFAPDQNVRGGSAYLDALLTRYHDNLALALAAYNAGPAAVDKYHGIPPYAETRAYVARVIHEFNRRVLAREAAAQHAQNATR
jgi:soluble lytic murein transglycosylase-like protein